MTNEQRAQCASIITAKASDAADRLVAELKSGASFSQKETAYAMDMLRTLEPIADINLDQNTESEVCADILNTVHTTQSTAYAKATKIGRMPLFGKMCRQSFYTVFEAIGQETANQLYLLKMKEGAAATSDC